MVAFLLEQGYSYNLPDLARSVELSVVEKFRELPVESSCDGNVESAGRPSLDKDGCFPEPQTRRRVIKRGHSDLSGDSLQRLRPGAAHGRDRRHARLQPRAARLRHLAEAS
jgi:hypothetical protein